MGQPACLNRAFPVLMDAALRWPTGNYEMVLGSKRERKFINTDMSVYAFLEPTQKGQRADAVVSP